MMIHAFIIPVRSQTCSRGLYGSMYPLGAAFAQPLWSLHGSIVPLGAAFAQPLGAFMAQLLPLGDAFAQPFKTVCSRNGTVRTVLSGQSAYCCVR